MDYMNTVPFEAAAFFISLIALIYGIRGVIKYEIPMYFRLPVAAVGCYVLEELWVIVNTIFGNYGSFITVRLFGVFGFFCFLLCANTGGIDKTLDEDCERNKKARIVALAAPVLLLALFSILTFNKFRSNGISHILLSYLVFAPAFPSSYYNLKHLLIETDGAGFLKCVRGCDVLCLVIYCCNLIYLINYPENLLVLIYITDIIMALLVLTLTVLSVRGGKKWKAML